jgi:hypothetical protein
VSVLASRQFVQRYVFFTDPTYATTNLVLTRVRGMSGFSEVSIDCLGGDVTGWKDVDGAGKYQVAHVDLVRGGNPVAQCTGSRHEAKSKGAVRRDGLGHGPLRVVRLPRRRRRRSDQHTVPIDPK